MTGLEPEQGLVLVNDPAQRKLLKQDRSSFEREWSAAGKWTLLALPQPAASLIPNARLLLFLLLSYAGLSLRPDRLLQRSTCRPSQAAFCGTTLAGDCQPRQSRHRILPLTSISTTARHWPSWGAGTMRSQAFAAGARLQPGDKRFPLELAGVAFKQKQYTQAARYLRRALHLDPNDSYGNDFLGTVYFLQGNIEAALKYWNHVDKPQIAEVRTQPTPQVNAALLDRAFVFAPASTLRLARSADDRSSHSRAGNLSALSI